MHKPIQFSDLGLSFSHKSCFSDFSGQILYGNRIAIIGRNGEGKSTLLKMLQGTWNNYTGSLALPTDLRIGYLPQLVDSFVTLSGGERLQRALTEALCQDPNLLLLDEPTNHLDRANRRSLMRHLSYYSGTLIMVTHDVELLQQADTLWHIHQGQIFVFNGNYEEYQQILAQKNAALEQALCELKQQKKAAHQALMKVQERTKNMRLRGEKSIEQRKWPTVRSSAKLGNSVKTGDKRSQQIHEKKQQVLTDLTSLYSPEVIYPTFQLDSHKHSKTEIIIENASVSYENGPTIIQDLQWHMRPKERLALQGDNGSGKSTFIKAMLDEPGIKKTGNWIVPLRADIGYLDQHYQNLDPNQTVLTMVSRLMPKACDLAIRKHLNTFLFRKNEEVSTQIANLSGGEKARLSLCCIAAAPPALLILDEMTNNLDLETRMHVIQVLKQYPGALLVISHDQAFLDAIAIETTYVLHQGGMITDPHQS